MVPMVCGEILSRATDFGFISILSSLRSGGIQSVGLLSRVTDFGWRFIFGILRSGGLSFGGQWIWDLELYLVFSRVRIYNLRNTNPLGYRLRIWMCI